MVNEKAALFQFKMAMATSSLGMSSVVRGDDKKIELWVHGRNELYSLEAIKGNVIKSHASITFYFLHRRRSQGKCYLLLYLFT